MSTPEIDMCSTSFTGEGDFDALPKARSMILESKGGVRPHESTMQELNKLEKQYGDDQFRIALAGNVKLDNLTRARKIRDASKRTEGVVKTTNRAVGRSGRGSLPV